MGKKLNEKSLRISNIISGLIQMILAIMVLLFSVAAVLTLLLFLSIGIIIAGIARILNAISNKKLGNAGVVWKFLSGIFVIIIGIIIFFNIITSPTLTIQFLIFIYALAFLVIGLARIVVGIVTKEFYTLYRILIIIVGILSIGLSVIALLSPELGFIFLIYILSVSLLFNGTARLILGIIGTEY